LRRIRSQKPKPVERSGCAESRKITAISANGGSKLIALVRMRRMMATKPRLDTADFKLDLHGGRMRFQV
jgi:hypothetical protein